MTTPLFQEALLEANKLRETAEQEAKNAILESITPIIRKMIDREISGDVILEEVEDLPTSPISPEPTSTQTVPSPLNMSNQTPPVPQTGDMQGLMNVPLPDASGKIVVDIEELFNKPEEITTPGSLPTDETPKVDEDSFASFAESVEMAGKYFETAKNISGLDYSLLENQIFDLYGSLKSFGDKKVISNQLSKLYESKLESLYAKLQNENNSYIGIVKKDKSLMSLKDFTKALFEEAEQKVKQDVVNHFDKSADQAGAHAKKITDKAVEDPGKKENKAAPGVKGLKEELDGLNLDDEGQEKLKECGDEHMMADDVSGDMSSALSGGESAPKAPVQGVDVSMADGSLNINIDLDELKDDDMVDLVHDDEPESLPSSEMAAEMATMKTGLEEAKKQIASLKKDLGEFQLLSAKTLYENKLYHDYPNLTESQRSKIAGHFGGTKTLTEAKQVFKKIKGLLEGKKVEKPLNESKQNDEAGDQFKNRWKKLAGISGK